MKFLHEYLEYNDGTIRDNGWWEIDGNKLYNIKGGFHYYDPSPNDIIIEADGWDDVPLEDFLCDDTAITGWIAPDGKFYGCDPMDHDLIASRVLHSSEEDLEEKGYVKIFRNPGYLVYIMREKGYDIDVYEFLGRSHLLTEAQKITLAMKGFDPETGRFLGTKAGDDV